jgi:hypothetical protein
VGDSVTQGLERSSPTRGEQYMNGLTAGAFGCRHKDVEVLPLADARGNAVVLRPHLCSTSSEILEALLRRNISSTSRDGPEITVESDDLRNVRKRTPPRRCVDDVSTFELSKYEDVMGPPRVRSRPFLVPPLYPPAAVTFISELGELVGARWKYLTKYRYQY